MSQSTVQSVFHDSQGFMWFGTLDGLNKYDGYEINIYRHNPENPFSISDNDIRVIYEDSQNNLWIGTQNRGLNLYDRGKDRFKRFIGSADPEEWLTISSNTVWAILEDSHGILWVGTAYGLNIMNRNRETFQRIFHEPDNPESLSGNHITTLHEDDSGTLWIGTNNGINRYDRESQTFKRYEHFTNQNRLVPFGMIRSIYEDQHGKLWIGSEDNGLFLFDAVDETFTQFTHDYNNPFSISGNAIFSIIEDDAGNLWIGTGNDGLNIYDRENDLFYRYVRDESNPYSISNNGIVHMYNSGNYLWIGTYAGGVNFHELKEDIFSHFSHDPQNSQSLSSNVVQAFQEDENGNIWVGTDGGGLNLFNPESGQFQRFVHQPGNSNSLSNNGILDLHMTDLGLWIGTYGGGVDLYDAGSQTFTNFSQVPDNPQSLSSNYVFNIHESRDGNIWFGTNWGGVTKYDPQNENFIQYLADPDNPDDPNSLSNNDVRSIFEDSYGDIWIGAYGGNVDKYDRETGRFSRYNFNEQGIYFGSVAQSIHEDSSGRLWFGTRGAGLIYYDRDSDMLVPYATMDHNLPSNVIHAVIEDNNGNLWLSSNNGITRYNPETKDLINFNIEHGLNNREYSPGAVYKDGDGYIYFGGINGFNRFNPDHVRVDSTLHPVVLTEFLIYNEPVPIGEESVLEKHISQLDKLVIPYNETVLTFGYSALNFSSTKNNQFAYMLEGFDENWNYVGSQRRATYTNLSPGEYIFKVRTANNDGIWDDTGVSITIQITPPFWRTAWFIVLMILTLVIGTYALFRMRIKQIRFKNIELERQVRERTQELRKSNETKNRLFSIIAHDLRNYASSFVGFTSLLKESAEENKFDEVKEYANYLDQASNQFIDFLKNLLDWARTQTNKIQYRPEIFDLGKIINHVLMQTESNAINKKIEINCDANPNIEAYADPNLLTIVIYNLLNNSIKFSEEGSKIDLSAKLLDDDQIKITVRDYGVGMDKETVQKLLSPDEYVTTSGTAGEKGTGLGFSLCKDFIRRNKGTITLESEMGKGTTVQIIIPANDVHKISAAS